MAVRDKQNPQVTALPLVNSLMCGCRFYSKYLMFTSITVFIAQGLRAVLEAPLCTGFDEWMLPLWD